MNIILKTLLKTLCGRWQVSNNRKRRVKHARPEKTILQQLIYKLLYKVDPETGCVRSVMDHGFGYKLFEAIDQKMSWYIALDEDGILLSFGMDYDDVVAQAETCIDFQREMMDDEVESEEVEGEDLDDVFDESEVPTDPMKLN